MPRSAVTEGCLSHQSLCTCVKVSKKGKRDKVTFLNTSKCVYTAQLSKNTNSEQGATNKEQCGFTTAF